MVLIITSLVIITDGDVSATKIVTLGLYVYFTLYLLLYVYIHAHTVNVFLDHKLCDLPHEVLTKCT